MLLKSFHVTTFQGVLDSGPVDVDEITCLVGKNEAGKTALLKALYRLNPIRGEDANFNVTDDYPRSDVSDYEHGVQNAKPHAAVVEGIYELEADEISAIEDVLGPSFLKDKLLCITKYYDNNRTFILRTDEGAAVAYLSRNLTGPALVASQGVMDVKSFAAALEPHASDAAVAPIIGLVRESANHNFAWYAFNKILKPSEPQYLYFDEYYQMRGCENVQALQARTESKQLLPSDHPLLGLIELARLDLTQLVNPQRT
jgi:hypothetical protein